LTVGASRRFTLPHAAAAFAARLGVPGLTDAGERACAFPGPDPGPDTDPSSPPTGRAGEPFGVSGPGISVGCVAAAACCAAAMCAEGSKLACAFGGVAPLFWYAPPLWGYAPLWEYAP